MALAEKTRASGKVVLAFAGDGTLGEGVLYESLNLAALWKLPMLFVIENNRYAQTTPIRLAVAGSIPGRFAAFGIPTWERETMDVLEVQSLARTALDAVRGGSGPGALILHTYRFAAHSKGDDVRDPAEIAAAREKDPLAIQAPRLSQAERELAEREVGGLIADAFQRAAADPLPDLERNGARP